MRKYLIATNKVLEKWMPAIAPASLLLGVLLSQWLKPYTGIVPWVFAFMTFSGSLGSSFSDLKRVLLHPLPLMACLCLLHVWIPLVAWGTGSLVFHGDPLTVTGVLLAFIIPTGIISFMWVSIYKGNIALTLSLILIDTFLSPFVVPFTLELIVGTSVHIDTWGMMKGLIYMVVLPSLLGMLLNQRTKGGVKTAWGPVLAPFSKLGLAVVVSINSSVVAPYFAQINGKLLAIVLTVLAIAASGYFFGWQAARLFKWDRDILVALTFNSGMRNISAGTVLAITYFPPPVALPVIAGSLFQQLLASTYAHLLSRWYGTDDSGTGKGKAVRDSGWKSRAATP